MKNKTMSLGCESAAGSGKTSCLSEFAGKYADNLCEFCCTSDHYCNALKSFDKIAALCLALGDAKQLVCSVCTTLLAVLVASYIAVR